MQFLFKGLTDVMLRDIEYAFDEQPPEGKIAMSVVN